MSQIEPLADPAAPSKEFVDQVKQALEHLYDFSFLQRPPLAAAFPPVLYKKLRTPETAVEPGWRLLPLKKKDRDLDSICRDDERQWKGW